MTNIPVSLASSGWITFLIENAPYIPILSSDVNELWNVKEIVESLMTRFGGEWLLPALPAEVVIFIFLAVLIYVILLPTLE